MPKISVIMPAYNSEKYIAEAIESILSQTFTDFEFIIIDDGSTDRTVEIISRYNDSRIRFYQNENNMGVAATLNRGLDLATGEYIARMDSDDISLPDRFKKQVEYLDGHLSISVLATNVKNFGADNKSWPSSETNDELKVDLLFNCCMCHPTVMMRSKIIHEYSFTYDVEYNGLEDYELWERMIQVCKFSCLKEELYMYRIHPNQVTKTFSESNFLKYTKLKHRILQRIGCDIKSDGAHVFVKYCFGNRNLTDRERSELKSFLMVINDKNKCTKVYKKYILRNSLKSIVLYTCKNSSERCSFIVHHLSWFCGAIRIKIPKTIRTLVRG